MKIIKIVLVLVILSACGQNKIQATKKIKKISVHILTSDGMNSQAANWYYIRNRNTSRDKGYYFESKEPVQNFVHTNFIYYNARPDKLNEIYPLKEKIILVNAGELPQSMQQSIADLESISVSN